VPEFGAGSHTFNAVFGATRNPYDPARTAGGSSGGAAAALAARLTPLADGSDMGGSLRNPAAFTNVVGFRPSPGRVPSHPSDLPWATLGPAGTGCLRLVSQVPARRSRGFRVMPPWRRAGMWTSRHSSCLGV
jgi:hypothetical protein